MSFTTREHQLLLHLAENAKLASQIDPIVAEFRRTKAQANPMNLMSMLRKLGQGSATARAAVSSVMPDLEKTEPIETMQSLLRQYAVYLANPTQEMLKEDKHLFRTKNRQSRDHAKNPPLQPVTEAQTSDAAAPKKSRDRETLKQIGNNDRRSGSLPHASANPSHLEVSSAKTTSAPSTASKFAEVSRRLSAAASVGLSKAARNSQLNDFAGGDDNGGKENIVNGNPQDIGGSLLLDDHYLDALSLRRRQTLWQVNHYDAPQFQRRNADALMATAQEQLLIGELLYSLTGIGGTFIRADRRPIEKCSSDDRVFTISDQINCSMRDLVAQMLQLGAFYTTVDNFVVQHCNEYHSSQRRIAAIRNKDPPTPGRNNVAAEATSLQGSQVLQALASTMRQLLVDYQQTICVLEADASQLTLPKMLHMLRPTRQSMAVLAQTVDLIERYKLRGAAVLSMLHQQIVESIGDKARQAVLEHLLERAAVPYMHTLELWIVKGVIMDPLREFMVREDNVETGELKEESYWHHRYMLVNDRIPIMLKGVSPKVIRTGKYLNVIRQCGHTVDGRKPKDGEEMTADADGIGGIGGEPLRLTANGDGHLVFIERAYHHASHRLLEVLVDENDLMGHLASVKRYLLMQQGDFIEQFMDVAEEELSKNVDLAMPSKLENLLGLVLRITSAKDNKYIDELRVQIYDCDLQTQMAAILNVGGSMAVDEADQSTTRTLDITGFEGFSFDYEVRWPLSLVINDFSLTFYKTVFRLLFYFKHVQRQLGRMWIHNKNVKRFENGRMSDVQRSTFSLSHRMIHAVQNIEYFVMLEVVEPLWQQFLDRMAEAMRSGSVDQVIDAHQKFTSALVDHTMLGQPDLLSMLIKICRLCLNFSHEVMRQTEMLETETFAKEVIHCNDMFTIMLTEMLAIINGNQVGSANRFVNLVHRLNFNSFYSDKMEANAAAASSELSASKHSEGSKRV